jgi:hypothetical protein
MRSGGLSLRRAGGYVSKVRQLRWWADRYSLAGKKVSQTLPCDLTRSTGGFEFDDVPIAIMTLRASAPGYVSQGQTVEVGLLEIITFTLVPTGL